MPYELREQSGRYCVYKIGDDTPLECYSSKDDALAYLGALEANVEDAKMTAYKRLGDTIKALDDYRVGGYLVRFTEPNDTDLHGEYFDKSTDFWIEKGYPIKGDRILLEHGLDDFAKVMPVGIIDLLEEDDIGLYVEGRLFDRAKYEEMLEGMTKRGIRMSPQDIQRKAELAEKAVRAIVETGKVQWSSGALPQSVVIDNKHIKSWAIIEGSLTFTPAEPNGTEIAPLKSAFKELSALMSIPKQNGTVTDAQHREPTISFDMSSLPSDVTVTWSMSNTKSESNKGNKNMEEMLAQILAMLQEMASKMGMGEEESLEAVASVGEELRADMQEEEMKQMDEEEMAKAISEKAFSLLTAKIEKWRKAQNSAKSALESKFAAYQKDALPNPQAFAGGKSNQRRPQISVGELQKYAHLSGHDMALGVKLALATASPWEKRGMTVGKMIEKGIFSEEYMKVMAHKMVDEFAAFKPRDGMARGDQLAVKSAYPFKADDINATDITGFGLEWVELQYDTTLWEMARDRTDLFNMLSQRGMEVKTVPQGANGLNIKLNTSSGTVYTMPESNDLDATGRPEVVAGITQFGTSEVEQPLATHVLAHSVTMQLEEDSIINVLSWLPGEMTQTLAESLENALLNGDETTTTNNNINLYDGTPGTGLTRPDYLAWDGLRHEFLVDNTSYGRSGGGALSLTDYEETKNLFPSAIKNRRANMLFIVDEKTESTTRRFPELLTFGVAGNQATVYSGDLPPLFGVPVYMSGFLELAASTGKNSATPANNTRGTIICVYAPYWVYGRKREIVIEQDRNSLSQTTTFVATVRHLFKSRGAGAAAGTYNAGTY